jgi:hypothetical protein
VRFSAHGGADSLQKAGIATIMVAPPPGTLFGGEAHQKAMEQSITHVVRTLTRAAPPIAIAGFSAGGTDAVTLGERCARGCTMSYPVRAIAAGDPPLDFARVWDAAEMVAHVAVRACTEPDVQWWLENRNADYYQMNALDAAALIRRLRVLGNTRAELITTTNKGYRPGGRRHPHSWSIIDQAELAAWVARALGS